MTEKTLYVGLDQSINASGLTLRTNETDSKFYLISPDPIKHSRTVENITYVKQASKNYSKSDLLKIKNGHNLGMKILRMIIRQKELKGCTNVKCAMEGAVMSFGFKKNQARLNDLIAYNTMIKYVLMSSGEFDKFEIVPPKTLKKFFTGKGNCNKDDMVAKFLSEVPGFVNEHKVDDIADSYALSKYIEQCK